MTTNAVKVIAEIANAHEGSFGKLCKMVEIAVESKADAVKFQLYRAKKLVAKDHPKYENYQIKEFSEEEWIEISNLCREKGIEVVAEIFDYESLIIARKMEISGYKVHSTTISDLVLLKEIAKENKPLYLSAGGSTKEEIHLAISTIKKCHTNEIILMQGYQNFPTELPNIHLNKIESLNKEFNLPVGIQDHVAGEDEMAMIVPLMAAAKGCVIIEKHFTIDRSLKETDYYSSLNPDELKRFVSLVRKAELTFGSDAFELSEDEMAYRNLLKKSIYSANEIKKGEKITLDQVVFKRTLQENRLTTDKLNLILDKTAKENIPADAMMQLEMLEK
ncbi:MAG: hypothetical protein COA57_01490 [Flavobacteriales bacterium]|nr:MAG: hypothetical protein COA57_01490 [Flavobacteriales bacterium]